MMRMIALIALAIAAMAALWYTSVRGLPYYYDAMIFVLAIPARSSLSIPLPVLAPGGRGASSETVKAERRQSSTILIKLFARSDPGSGTSKNSVLTGLSRAIPVSEKPLPVSINF
jgi:hypothetical protein